MDSSYKKKILLVDDNPDIHQDFRKILSKNSSTNFDQEEALIFGINDTANTHQAPVYEIDSAYQGQEALELIRESLKRQDPYALAFIDIRMPPGWNGIETIKRIWAIDPHIQMVIVSAYSEHSWEDITRELGHADNLLILKKPFEVIEINQMASALTTKWELIANLNTLVKSRTAELENLYSLTHTTLESSREGFIALGLDNQIIMHNSNFLKQWDLSSNELKSETAKTIFKKLAERVEDPILFLEVVTDLKNNHKIKGIKECRLKNGKLLELYAHPQYLHNEVIGMVFNFLDITERNELENQLLHQATHDTLTGLPNRALVMDRIKQAILHAKRFNKHVGVLILDLDYFKEINDSLGHNAGDLLLQCLAKRLSQFVRGSDTVARLGGDEFVIILGEQDNDNNFIPLLDRLVEQFSQPCQLEDHEVTTTASIGISIYPRDGEEPNILLKNADAALYQAKELGRNRYQFYQAEFNKHIMERTELKIALNLALQKNELSIDYQPLVDLKTNRIIGVEALLRWQHPTLGSIPPTTFIPIAEESSIILTIGEWVLKTACAQAKIWNQFSPTPDIKISVNISPKQFSQKNFVEIVRQILQETQLNPKYLVLEITESLILKNMSDTIQKMNELKKLGLQFAIDDFGTGYSSLSYLKHFPFDTVKIDKTFIDNITSNTNNASIVKAIIAMTKSMGIDVLAEGVEHQDQVAFLREHHGNQMQGFYFSKPLTQDQCTKLLENGSTGDPQDL